MFKENHIDIIKEVINIGIGEAAAVLSDLVNARVHIQVPDVKIMDAADTPDYLQNEMENLGVYISQVFHGGISGKSVLCYSQEASRSLLEILMQTKIETLSLSDAETATLQEIGNLILVSCLSAISNTIKDRFLFDMPHVALNGYAPYFENLGKDIKEFGQAIVVKTEMVVKKINVRGYIFILFEFSELQSVIERLEKKMILGGDE